MTGDAAPWRADRELAPEQARAAIAASFPELATRPVAWLDAGWDNDVYRVGTAEASDCEPVWVFRFPRRRVVADDLPREWAVLDLAAPLFARAGLRVPRAEKRGGPSEHFPYRFGGARLLPGVAVDRSPRLEVAAFAERLGAALAALHALPAEGLRGLGLDPEPREPAARLAALAARRAELEPLLPRELAGACAPWLAGDVPAPADYAGPPRLLHDDLVAEHVHVDPATGVPVGVLDFADAALGDPALDLAGLLPAVGPRAVARLGSCYARRIPTDVGLVERATFLGRVTALLRLGDACRRHGESARAAHVARVGRAFTSA